jgi:hypothetical protein
MKRNATATAPGGCWPLEFVRARDSSVKNVLRPPEQKAIAPNTAHQDYLDVLKNRSQQWPAVMTFDGKK